MSAAHQLVLMRHAKSDWSFNEPDHARTLNPRGRRSADALGDWLRGAGYLPDQVLCSTSVRTRETLDLLKIDAPVRYEERLFHADAETVLSALRDASGTRVLIVGHNPGLQYMAQRIVAQAPAHPRFADYPTGATLVADFDIEDWAEAAWGAANPVDFVVPRELIQT